MSNLQYSCGCKYEIVRENDKFMVNVQGYKVDLCEYHKRFIIDKFNGLYGLDKDNELGY